MAPFNSVVSSDVPADVALSRDFVKLIAVEKIGKENHSSEFYVQNMSLVDADSRDSPTARSCVCPFWFIRDVVVDGVSNVVYLTATEDVVDVGCSVKGKDAAKRIRNTLGVKVTVPLYTNDSDLPVGTRLAVQSF